MDTQALERYLNSFGKYIVKQARTKLTKGKKNVSKKLYNSIRYEVTADNNGFTVDFFMSSYAKFLDKGVSGTQAKRRYKDYKGQTKSSPYSYKNREGHSQPPSKALDRWIVKRGIAPRDEKGKFMSRKSISFLIARSIGRKGIQGISFFQKPLMLGLKKFGKEMLGAIKEDILNTLDKETITQIK